MTSRVLNNVSFEIPEGEIVGVIGRSGAGKSVLMHLLRGVEQPPTKGTIIYHMAACDRCSFMDVQSRAGKNVPSVAAISWPLILISGTRRLTGRSPG